MRTHANHITGWKLSYSNFFFLWIHLSDALLMKQSKNLKNVPTKLSTIFLKCKYSLKTFSTVFGLLSSFSTKFFLCNYLHKVIVLHFRALISWNYEWVLNKIARTFSPKTLVTLFSMSCRTKSLVNSFR